VFAIRQVLVAGYRTKKRGPTTLRLKATSFLISSWEGTNRKWGKSGHDPYCSSPSGWLSHHDTWCFNSKKRVRVCSAMCVFISKNVAI